MSNLITKYRPQSFDAVIGQDAVVRSLKNSIHKKLACAYLFVGNPGLGKTTLARICAKELNCKNLIEVDAATHTGVDNMRALTQNLPYKALDNSCKGILIDELHRATTAALSSLLKIIEEPPSNVYWFLCTTELQKVLPAIRTRCQVFELKPVDEAKIYNLLCDVCDSELFDTPDDVLDLISTEANGSPRQALSYLAAAHDCKTRQEAAEIINTTAESKEIIDLCRFLVNGKGITWPALMKYAKPLENQYPETIRITISAYVSKVLSNTTEPKKAARLLTVLECFSQPYPSSDKLGPLLLSLGQLMFSEEQ